MTSMAARRFVLHALFSLALLLRPDGVAGRAVTRNVWNTRGGFLPRRSSSVVEEYVAQVEERDTAAADNGGDGSTSSAANDEKEPLQDAAPVGEEPTAVGVKAAYKKSNAVGDPDGEGSDDDSDSEDEEEEHWEDFEEDMILDPTTQVQVEVELMEDDELDDISPSMDNSRSSGGGVGIRLASRLGRRKNNKIPQWREAKISQTQLWEAWQSYVYLPPGPAALDYLKTHTRALDGASKTRLDRRTLYAALIQEWLHVNPSYRKFLDASTSQALQAALSMATQPQWRKAFPRHNGVRLYDDEPKRGCTLAMQETIAMALAHSLGAGMVILDDDIVQAIRQQLLREGYSEDEVKSAALIQSLLDLARQGKMRQSTGGAISKCMQRDLAFGLDDPFDERATASCQDMCEWEKEWDELACDERDANTELPLVIFVRSESSSSLLKSKSVTELLLQECTSSESINLVILGKGIDAKTTSLPHEPVQEVHEAPMDMTSRNLNSAAPWFGFSPHNQNASGQNDPEGSRRFNIFLARTVDPSGTPGILGAIAPPQAGNLFPHMMAMQARDRLQQHEEDSPVKAELERWAQLLQQQMQTNGGLPLPPPQFFNASLTAFENGEGAGFPGNAQPPPPEVIQQTLQQAMSELLDRLAQLNDDGDGSADNLSPDLHKAFAQVLRNDNLRRGIAENLARAAPALSDPKCQGVMLSVYVPPPPHHMNRGKLPGAPGKSQPNMGGWFQKILNNQDDSGEDEESRSRNSKKRVRTMAAAAAVMAAENAQRSRDEEESGSKAERNLARLESLCRPLFVPVPADPVRAKSWEAWIARERGAVIFRQNRRVLNEQLESHALSLQEHVGTRGAGSALRQMLSVRDISDEMEEVIKCAIELEAAKSMRLRETPRESYQKEAGLDVDITLSQLLLTEDGLVEDMGSQAASGKEKRVDRPGVQYIHPSSLESALTSVCRISPSPAGGLSITGKSASHRTREEIAALAQDKHERALISQVVSPQDIGVTYDMVGGLKEVKELLRQSITYPLKFPHLYSEGIAREAVKGVLLFGPPGTGKTMLAKAVATEGGASFLSVDASSVENKWLGESEKNAKAVFTLARRLAPCVIFIDEVDSLLSSREGSSDDSAHGTLTSVKTTMMSEWDGLNSGTNGAGEAGSDRVIVIGSTNRPFDLDEAVLRRFPRRILVDLPDLETRTEILEVTLAENRLDPAVNLTKIAERLEGYTGSDIKEVCREAVVQISHEQAKLLDQGVSDDTREDVTQGSLQRLRPVTAEDFEKALSKLKRSVSEKGRELARVWEWNDEYGEIKKESRNHLPHLANMYL